MPDYPHTNRYHRELAQLIEFGGVDNEENIRAAFQYCLAALLRRPLRAAGAGAGATY